MAGVCEGEGRVGGEDPDPSKELALLLRTLKPSRQGVA